MFIDSVVTEITGTIRRAAQGVRLTVNQNNVLEAARIIETESARFTRKVNECAADMYVDRMGDDPVSAEVARVLTNKLVRNEDSYVNRCLQYAMMLENLALALGEAAKNYGFTEEEIKHQFEQAKADGGQGSAHRGLRAI